MPAVAAHEIMFLFSLSSRSKSNAFIFLFFLAFSALWSKECFMVLKYTHSHIHGQSWAELISQWFGPVDMSWRGRYHRKLSLCHISVPPPPPPPSPPCTYSAPHPTPTPPPTPRAPASLRPQSLALYHWRELLQVWFLSRQKTYFCRDKTCSSQQNFVATNIILVAALASDSPCPSPYSFRRQVQRL